MTNYLFRLNEDSPSSDIGIVYRLGPQTGTVSFSTVPGTHMSIYPNLRLFHTGVNNGTTGIHIARLFSGSLPKRFIWRASFSEKVATNTVGDLYLIVGTDEGTTGSFNGFGFKVGSNPNTDYINIANGVLSSSTLLTPMWSNSMAISTITSVNSFNLEFEMRQNSFTDAPNQFMFRGRIVSTVGERDSETTTFSFGTKRMNSASVPTAWNGKTFDRIYLGYRNTFGGINSGSILMDECIIMKHYMDWD